MNFPAAANKLNITDAKELEKAEGSYTSWRIGELVENPIKGNFDVAHLKAVHRHIFQDVYQHAGQFHVVEGIRQKIRVSEVTGEKSAVYYPPIGKAENTLEGVLKTAGTPATFIAQEKAAFAERMANLYAKVDYLHPFAEGNSRTLRVFTEQLAKEAGRTFDWGESNASAAARDNLYAARDQAVLQMAIHDVKSDRQLMDISHALHKLEKQPSLAQVISSYINATDIASAKQFQEPSKDLELGSGRVAGAERDQGRGREADQQKDPGKDHELRR